MRFIKEEDRTELCFQLSNMIEDDNEVRIIDAFVDKVDLISHGFIFKTDKGDKVDLGGPSEYHPKILLKLYIYGYVYQLRSSRKIAKQCLINLEVKWLISNLQPSHNTINKFRKNNPAALKTLFRTFNVFWKGIGLFGDNEIAIDGSYFAAQNSKEKNYSAGKLKKKIDYIDKKTNEYLALLDQADKEDNDLKLSKNEVDTTLKTLAKRKEKYNQLSEALQESGETQISLTDPDARLLSKGKGAQMAFNMQIATEEEHKLIAHFDVINKGDRHVFHQVAKETKDFLQDDDQNKSINALGDKGFNDDEQIHKCDQDNIVTYIAHTENSNSKKDTTYSKDKFTYNREEDTYKCPQNQTLKTTGKLYQKGNKRRKGYHISFSVCANCPVKNKCLTKYNLDNRKGKEIVRTEFENAKDDNRKRLLENKEIYQRRKAMVEHPFGTIKRQWGYSYTLLKGLEKVSGEFALIFSAYNLRRAISILGVKQIINRINQVEILVFWLFPDIFMLTQNTSHHIAKKETQYHKINRVLHPQKPASIFD